MMVSDMDEAFKMLDRRLQAVEQILPTLATKNDLEGVKDEILAATRTDSVAFKGEILAATRMDFVAFKEEILAATRMDFVAFREEILAATRMDFVAFKEDILATTRMDFVAFREEILVITREDLQVAMADAKHHTDVRVEDIRDDIRRVADGVAALAADNAASRTTLVSLVERLDRHEDILHSLTNRRRKRR